MKIDTDVQYEFKTDKWMRTELDERMENYHIEETGGYILLHT